MKSCSECKGEWKRGRCAKEDKAIAKKVAATKCHNGRADEMMKETGRRDAHSQVRLQSQSLGRDCDPC